MLSVGTLNVWGRWADWPARLAALRSSWPAPGPDVLMLQEVVCDEEGDQAREIADALAYPECVSTEGHRVGDGYEGVAILSRRSLRDRRHESLPSSDPGRRVLLADVDAFGGRVTVACGHTVAMPEGARLEQVHALLARPEDPLVLGADLNETPTTVSPVLSAVGLTDVLGADRTATWPMCEVTFGEAWRTQLGRAPQFSLEPRRLDYLLVRGLHVSTADVHELRAADGRHASDHALVVATLAGLRDGRAAGD